jgi:hypothetical protein
VLPDPGADAEVGADPLAGTNRDTIELVGLRNVDVVLS